MVIASQLTLQDNVILIVLALGGMLAQILANVYKHWLINKTHFLNMNLIILNVQL